jgi:tetratricopeptide (TPR) repeat protein
MFIGRVDTPRFRAALLDFVQGKSGSDERRNAFALELSKRQWLESDTVKMWIEGEQAEIQFTQTEIYWDSEEADSPLSPEASNALVKARQLAKKRDYEGAIKVLTKMNAKEPGQPTILYNIAAYRALLGDIEFFDDTVDQLIRDFPDYFFAKTAYAKRLCVQRRIEEAWEILKPLQAAKRLHISEYRAFSVAMIMYHLVNGEAETAESLHQSSAEMCGDSFPALERLKEELEDGFGRF